MNNYPLPAIVSRSDNEILRNIAPKSFEEFEHATKGFVRQSALRLKAGDWLHDQRPSKQFCSGDVKGFRTWSEKQRATLYTPFVEKHIFPSGAKIAVLGDIHGDIDFFASVVDHLHHHGILDDEYHIVQDDFYIVFAGDYVNRGQFSVEVMMLLFHLHTQNIGKVFVLRGNHEYISCNKHFYETLQGHEKVEDDSRGQESLLGEIAYKFDVYYFPDLLYWYDYLPRACFLGCADRSTGKTNMISFCHAGIELGYNSSEFLASTESRYQLLLSLSRYDAVQDILSNNQLRSVHDRIREVFHYLEKSSLESWAQTYTKKDIIDLKDPYKLYRLGMQWNCFLSEDHDCGFAASLGGQSLQFGQALTKYYFDRSSSENVKIVSMVRSHQHRNDHEPEIGLENTMLDQLIQTYGCVRQWNGLVYTLGDSGMRIGYQSFMTITLAEKAEKWTVEHFFKRPEEKQFSVETFKMLGSL
ncbi:MAG: metallophosphoesterase [bacterium]